MAEDQGVNGDSWNDKACLLFQKLGWSSIGDSNIDIPGDNGKVLGVDRLFKFFDIRKASIEQGVILESKRYLTTSFSVIEFQKWIERLNTKINNVKHSEKFYQDYVDLYGTDMRNGLIVIWFADTLKYLNNNEFFKNALLSIKTPRARSNNVFNRIYVLENEEILRLCSLIDAMDRFNKKNYVKLSFYYPQSDHTNTGVSLKDHITIDYIFSRFILAQGKDNDGIEKRVVFYFGDIDTKSFLPLFDCLKTIGFVDYSKPLTIFNYKKDESFRKVKPDIERMFASVDAGNDKYTFSFQEMNHFTELPDFLNV